MNIAIPILNDRVSPVLDTAARLLLVTCRQGKESARREIVLGLLAPKPMARALAELQVSDLLCAALSAALLRALQDEGIRVHSHLCGPVDAIGEAFARGQLDRDAFRMPGCWGRHDDDSGTCTPRAATIRRSNVAEVRHAS